MKAPNWGPFLFGKFVWVASDAQLSSSCKAAQLLNDALGVCLPERQAVAGEDWAVSVGLFVFDQLTKVRQCFVQRHRWGPWMLGGRLDSPQSLVSIEEQKEARMPTISDTQMNQIWSEVRNSRQHLEKVESLLKEEKRELTWEERKRIEAETKARDERARLQLFNEFCSSRAIPVEG